ncbi:DUF4352 domain-containing protein [Salipaludibacillus sp. CUR1]|uniref:DUF4352 domain-containing protein n=1 Tax=Salipaludibacillus sp. CUR1 TaxID=2820003 RepID=UPI001E2EB967|nr:DUF4352 domain-containing protein [Salipaludibacillus sp. CUR1]MCE7794791.1 DUF4352 domain-containing protein [Salipaludibacillus sp. CUR1]
MKKLITVLSLTTLVSVSGCANESADNGDENTDTGNGDSPQTEQNNDPATNEENNNGSANKEPADDMAEAGDEAEAGDTIETESGTYTLHAREDNVENMETGPIHLEVDQVTTASGEPDDEVQEATDQDHLNYVQVDLKVENNGDEEILFYSGQATLTTNTGEQLEPDLWLSDHIEGDMEAGTSNSGSFFYILENSDAEEIESIQLSWNAPLDVEEDWEEEGEDIEVEVIL